MEIHLHQIQRLQIAHPYYKQRALKMRFFLKNSFKMIMVTMMLLPSPMQDASEQDAYAGCRAGIHFSKQLQTPSNKSEGSRLRYLFWANFSKSLRIKVVL